MVMLEWLSTISAPKFLVAPQLPEVPPLDLKYPILMGSEPPSQEITTSLYPHQF